MIKLKRYLIGIFVFILLIVGYSYNQPLQASQVIPFDSTRWQIDAEESKVENYLGQESLFLKGGFAVIEDSNFLDGIIEYDVAFDKARGFIGALWRIQDLENYEKFYMRPHQSGNPDANQYSPVFNKVTGWQLYYGEGFGVPIEYPFNEWIHVKVVVSGNQGEIYVDDMNEPVLFIHDMKRELEPGKVGLIVEDFAPGHFANFTYTSVNNPPLKGQAPELEPVPAGTINSWFVSDAFDSKTLESKLILSAIDKQQLSWKKFSTERMGLLNLAKTNRFAEGQDTVFVRTIINSERDQMKPLEFGFSDQVKVYLNDQLIYSGSDRFRSRDYRFLGTIGYYDTVYLPLKQGRNELWLSVTETPPMGGWGVQARLKDPAGISIVQ
ncbi:MAG: hypothetical protein SAJ37_21955 [Oscillatoria sp. PMC 1068.18]|nr:hypothetical protein [Oscillatoria sp. PMC 1076.18]MEC4991408.1 hypothetical protein [Oscillatoria sp. PMC 1068.18]